MVSEQDSFYITTPIYYVNGEPHIGHAYTTIAADTAARYQRLKGKSVFFLTGTDEHGQKVLQKARERGMSPKEHCDDMVVKWQATWEKMGLSYDRFIRTTDSDHVAAVQAVLQALWDRGEIYNDEYTGWYSVSAERFWTEKDLVDGKCPETGQAVEEITETNYFFRMSKYQQRLLDHIEAHPDFIRPVSRRNEVLGFLREELGDLCISRPKSRMSWGIELPFDADYVTYVWFDALLNYLTGVAYHPNKDDEAWKSWWPAQYHLIGKDILTTHAVYWTTMLFALDIEPVHTLYAHGWWTSTDGVKMSKSLGNTIDVDLLVDEFGVDATRYFFLREIAFGADGNFSYETFMVRYNAELANDLGNLVHRGLSMTAKWLDSKVPAASPDEPEAALRALATDTVRQFDEQLERLQYDKALDALWALVRAGNKYVDQQEPWALNKRGETERLQTVMRHVVELCHLTAVLLLPVLPTKSKSLLAKLGQDEQVAGASLQAMLAQVAGGGELGLDQLEPGAALTVGEPLFPRFREMPEKIAALFEAAPSDAGSVEPPKAPKKKVRKAAAPSLIEIGDFAKVQLRTGKVLHAEAHPNADKLLVLKVDIGEPEPRQIVAGIATKFTAAEVVGRSVVVVANLQAATIRGVESQGMLLAAGGKKVVDLVSVAAEPGEIVR